MTKRTPTKTTKKTGSVLSDHPNTTNKNIDDVIVTVPINPSSDNSVKETDGDSNKKKRKFADTIEQGDSILASDYLKMIAFFEDKFDELKQFNNELVKKLETAIKDNQGLIERVDQLEDNEEYLKSEVDQLRSQVNDLEQFKLRKDIIIRNIEYHQSENIYDLASKVLSVVGKGEASDYIASCYRIKNRSKSSDPGSIIVSFTNCNVKDTVLELKTKLRIVNSDIGFENNNSQIYIQEHLSYHNQELFFLARQLRKFGYRFVWSKFGKIFVRKSPATRTVLIRSKDQVNLLLNKESTSAELTTSQLPPVPTAAAVTTE